MSPLEVWEMASYVVTVFGLPYAVMLFWYEQKRERQNEEEEIYQKLSDEYADFCQLLLTNADLHLMSGKVIPDSQLTDEQQERKRIIFDLLLSLFERAFILVYEEHMSKQTQRLWQSWDDYIRFWMKRDDFRKALDVMLSGEDPDFVHYMSKLRDSIAYPASK
ncbi:MAG: hypothetical protein EYC62_00965 [Alphaproteobacteria bacterium]|nr:MAG: hypothetical protein EYC62_00965 [Alphaproteobacteria bacterium]